MIYRPIISELPNFNLSLSDIQFKFIVYLLLVFIMIAGSYDRYHNAYYTLGLAVFLLATPIVKPLAGFLLDAPISVYEDYKQNPSKYKTSQLLWGPLFEIIPLVYMYIIYFFFIYLIDDSFLKMIGD